jgi:hypothetical protein
MWRKGRLQKFLRGKVLACRIDASHPGYDEVHTLRHLSNVLEFAPDCLDELLSGRFLSEKLKERLKRESPPEDFETLSARARAIQNEINSVILPSLERRDKPVQVSFLEAASIVTQDDFKNEIAVEERIPVLDKVFTPAWKRVSRLPCGHSQYLFCMLDRRRPYRLDRSPDWLKMKSPNAPARWPEDELRTCQPDGCLGRK